MAATFRTPGRKTPADAALDTHSPSLIPRAHHHGGSATPTGAGSELSSAVSGTTDSRKRQSKKDEVTLNWASGAYLGHSTEIGK